MDETATGQAETSSHFRIQSPILRRSLVCVIVNPAVAVVAAPTPVAVALAALVVSKSGSVCDRLQKPVRENWRCPRLWAMPSLSSTQTPHLGGTSQIGGSMSQGKLLLDADLRSKLAANFDFEKWWTRDSYFKTAGFAALVKAIARGSPALETAILRRWGVRR